MFLQQPMPMYGTSYVFSKAFFRFWVALTFLWGFGAALVITIMPLWEGRKSIMHFLAFARGKRGNDLVEGLDGSTTGNSDGEVAADGKME
jgi:hypothetical protein